MAHAIPMQAGLAKMKVTRPSAIQASVIPEILSTDNVAMQSYTGSGKVRRTQLARVSHFHPYLLISLPLILRGQEFIKSSSNLLLGFISRPYP